MLFVSLMTLLAWVHTVFMLLGFYHSEFVNQILMRFAIRQNIQHFSSLLRMVLKEFMREQIKSDFQVVEKQHDMMQFS